ncbi:F-box/kelch-repeat protein At3g06240-like [Rutidosis leptorrhynchoides]|uniref:F-box/kelch-repeat protein At3g06240-like n=1 Tax=Rutidosis leptorrhynchoides TaxID=125765 RepID=UPI003A99E68D
MDDVVEEIVTRLDVEDVVRCKSVCKSWYNLISSNYFVKAHLNRSYINNNREHGYLRIRIHWHFNVFSNGILPDCIMAGSCNGLVCISPKPGELLVTNPSTREVRKLPMLPYKIGINVWGFGYDSLTDDYKVVVGFNEFKHHMRFQVFSLKSNKWKFVGDCDYLTYNTYNTKHRICGFLYDGALHRFMDDTKNKKTIILSFDLSLEKFKEIPLPNDTKYVCDDYRGNRLGMFEERLCILRYNDIYAKSCKKWVMNNYNSWQLLPDDYKGNKYGAATPAYLLYFFKDNTWRLVDDRKENKHWSYQSWSNVGNPIFVKSLVSPYPCEKPKKKTKNNKRKRRKNKACSYER